MHRKFPIAGRLALAAAACALALAGPAAAQQWNFDEAQFNSWLTNGGSPQEVLESQVEMRVSSIEQVCTLTSEQRERLLLAGMGDVSRFETRVDALRKKLVGKTYDQNQINDIYMQIQPLAQEFRSGVLGRDSLFAKILEGTLDAKQIRLYEAAEARRRRENYAAKISVYVATVERGAPMTHEQRQALIKLIVDRSRPPMQFGQYDLQYVMYQASQAPKEELEKIFDEAQLKVIDALFQQGAGYGDWLKQQGIFPEEDSNSADPQPSGDDAEKEAK